MIIKKITYIFLLSIFFFSSINHTSFADDLIEEIEKEDFLETTMEITKDPNILSKNVAVIDRKTERILYQKDAYKKVAMASTTKIMTCIIALENCNLNEQVSISKKASSIHGSTLGISTNTKMSVIDLLYGLMLRSGNDCAIAIAEHISGNTDNFAVLMNEKARKLGLKNTNFVTPHGLDDDNHYTTAYELAILTNYALKNDIFKKIVSSKNYTITSNNQSRIISNTNELLGNLDGVYGVKTGFTFNAGRCLVSSCKRDDLDIIVVVLGADTKKIRTSDSRQLIQYVFNTYKYVDTFSVINENFNEYLSFFNNNIILEKTTDIPSISLCTKENYIYPLKSEEILNLSTKIYTISKFSPKISQNEKIGILTLYANDNILYSIDIIITNDLEKSSLKYYYNHIFRNFFNTF